MKNLSIPSIKSFAKIANFSILAMGMNMSAINHESNLWLSADDVNQNQISSNEFDYNCVFNPYIIETTPTYQSILGDECVESFEITVPRSGYYYPTFWVCPARHNDFSYTKYKIYVNDEVVDIIEPIEGNWQSISLSYPCSVFLNEGRNIIAVSTQTPEVPGIEKLKLTNEEYPESRGFHAGKYAEFLKNAEQSSTTDAGNFTITDDKKSTPSSIYASPNEFIVYPRLVYSFYKVFNWQAGENVSLETDGSVPHEIDIAYYMSRSSETNSYEYASPLETQCINWKGVSEPNSKSGEEAIQRIFRVPKTGRYLVRLHSSSYGVSGIVNLTINKNLIYNNCPVYYWTYSGFDTFYPMTMYECFLVSESDDSNPIIFVEGNQASRIVCIGNTCPTEMIEKEGFRVKDAYICQSFMIAPSLISVCEGSSLNPMARAKLTIRKYKDTNTYNITPKDYDFGEYNQCDFKNTDIFVSFDDNVINLNNSYTAERSVILTNIYGSIVWSCQEIKASYDVSSVPPGIYTLTIRENSSVVLSKKLIIH